MLKGDINDDLIPLITGADAVVSAYAPPFESCNDLVGFTSRLITAIKEASVPRLLMVGGAGGLKAGDTLVIDAPWFPAEWKPIAQAHIDALEVLKASDINWTTLTPPGDFSPG